MSTQEAVDENGRVKRFPEKESRASRIKDVYGGFLMRVYAGVREIVARECPNDIRPVLDAHLAPLEESKGFRPALVRASADILRDLTHRMKLDDEEILKRAIVVQLVHESTLIIDDVIDRGVVRRGQRAVHCRFGRIPAVFAAAWMNVVTFRIMAGDAEATRALSQALLDISEAEALQWNIRMAPRPIPIGSLERIADGDTAGLFKLASNLGGLTPSGEFGAAVTALSRLYHFLDDISDLLDLKDLGGGGYADLRDSIPTLPSAFSNSQNRKSLTAAIPDSLSYLEQYWGYDTVPQLRPFFEDLRNIWAQIPSNLKPNTDRV